MDPVGEQDAVPLAVLALGVDQPQVSHLEHRLHVRRRRVPARQHRYHPFRQVDRHSREGEEREFETLVVEGEKTQASKCERGKRESCDVEMTFVSLFVGSIF